MTGSRDTSDGPRIDEATKQSDNSTITLCQAEELERFGRLREAELAYQQLLRRDRHDPDAQHLLGLLCFRRGRAGEAFDLVRRASVSFEEGLRKLCIGATATEVSK